MSTYVIELKHGIVVQKSASSWLAAWAYARRVFGNNLRRVRSGVRLTQAA